MHGRGRHGCSRGIFGLKSWNTEPTVGNTCPQVKQVQDQTLTTDIRYTAHIPPAAASTIIPSREQSDESSSAIQGNTAIPKRRKLLAKYNYNANRDSPLGRELSIIQGCTLHLVEKTSDVWWQVENEAGDVGFVPASYVLVLDEQPSSLPWLQNKKPEDKEKEPITHKGVYRPYTPTYDHSDKGLKSPKEAELGKYYCKLCEKQLNGRAPYSAHMNSKAHKEEVQLAMEYGRSVE